MDGPTPLKKPIIDHSIHESSGGDAAPTFGDGTGATTPLSTNAAAVLSRTVFIIPVYNHAEAIGTVIGKVLAFKRPLFVIDDGSTDATPKVLEGLSGITVIRHAVNQGKGAALMTGFAAAAPLADWVITLDADGQHDPTDALALIKAVPTGVRPFIVGRRTHMLEKGAPWTSRWGRGFSNFWVWACSGMILSDTQSGFRLYPLPEVLWLNPRGRRFQFEVEVLVLAAWAKMNIIEVDISTQYRLTGHRISYFQPGMDFWRNTAAFSRLLIKRLPLPKNLRARKISPS
jgi:glycosyltransferase involved in cell wall biosynthesis